MQTKVATTEEVLQVFDSNCCSLECVRYFTYKQVETLLNKVIIMKHKGKILKFNPLKFQERNLHVHNALKNFQSEAGMFTISKQRYELKIDGITVCPHAFALLHCICYNTLKKCALVDAEFFVLQDKEPVCF